MRIPRQVTRLECAPQPDGKTWVLTDSLVDNWSDGALESCPYGMRTDFASVPNLALMFGIIAGIAHHCAIDWLFWFALAIVLLSKWIDDDDTTDWAACFHDQDYTRKWICRFMADWHFALRVFIARQRSENRWLNAWFIVTRLIKCFLYWFNLRLFGWWAWYRLTDRIANHLKLACSNSRPQ